MIKCYNCGKSDAKEYFRKPAGDYICYPCLKKFLSAIQNANPDMYNCEKEIRQLICKEEIERCIDILCAYEI